MGGWRDFTNAWTSTSTRPRGCYVAYRDQVYFNDFPNPNHAGVAASILCQPSLEDTLMVLSHLHTYGRAEPALRGAGNTSLQLSSIVQKPNGEPNHSLLGMALGSGSYGVLDSASPNLLTYENSPTLAMNAS